MLTITIGDVVSEIAGKLRYDELFNWPPDVFALTSILLGRTGAYRAVVSPPRAEMWTPEDPSADWQQGIEEDANAWNRWLCREGAAAQGMPKRIRKAKSTLERSFDLHLDALQLGPLHSDPRAEAAAQALLLLHMTADAFCGAFGLPHVHRAEDAPTRLLANMLLASTGSLSRLPPMRGVVVPKMRTPQVGMTLRSISHYVSFADAEVDVVWRAVPWVDEDEDTLNALLVPWPYSMEPGWFRPVIHPGYREHLGDSRYFAYAPPHEPSPGEIIELARAAERDVSRVHLLVLPELALTEGSHRALLDALAQAGLRRIPIVIAGIRSDAAAPAPTREYRVELSRNRVSLAVHFAGSWYEVAQDKHHRWRLDRRQIEHYGLGGMLSAEKMWWESIHLPPRQISVIGPNSWLALCPLICEDLARQDPVSSVVRAIGPTLLVALLLDGPQLAQRWAARYAGAFADDPGTSVLTLSALGMTRLGSEKGSAASETVALWKDDSGGAKEIRISEAARAVVATVTTKWKTERTADGRKDDNFAAELQLVGYRQVIPPAAPKDVPAHATPKIGVEAHRNRLDVFELTRFSYLLGAIVAAPREFATFRTWVETPSPGNDPWLDARRLGAGKVTILECLRNAYVTTYDRDGHPGSAESGWALESLRGALDSVESILSTVTQRILDEDPNGPPGSDDSWRMAVVDTCLERISGAASGQRDRDAAQGGERREPEQGEALRLRLLGAKGLLWAVHNELASDRRRGKLTRAGARMIQRICAALQ